MYIDKEKDKDKDKEIEKAKIPDKDNEKDKISIKEPEICVISSDDDDYDNTESYNNYDDNNDDLKVKSVEPVIARVESTELIKSHLEKLNCLYTHNIPNSNWIINKYKYIFSESETFGR